MVDTESVKGSTRTASPVIVPDVSTRSSQLPALTTTFTPPLDCSSKWLVISVSGDASITSGYVGTTILAEGIDLDYWKPCYASQTMPAYSPGICFSGQTVANILQRPVQVPSLQQPQMQWQGLCCPMFPADFRQSQSVFSTPFTVLMPTTFNASQVYDSVMTTLSTVAGAKGQPSVSTITYTIRFPSVVSSGTLWAAPVSVYWQSSDLYRFPSSYATSLASTLNVDLRQQAAPDGGLSEGAIARIVIGAIFGAGILCGSILLVLRRRRSDVSGPNLPEMSGQYSVFKKNLAGKRRAEADGTSEPVEIYSRRVLVIPGPPVELEGSLLQPKSSA